MDFHILTLFPELFESFQQVGLVGRAVASGHVSIKPRNLREFAVNAHGQIDDTPYGGGAGMVLRADAGFQAIDAARRECPGAKVIHLSPRGKPFTQAIARQLASERALIILCSRYEGIDERLVQNAVDEEYSIGDFVLMGGEVAAMAILESTIRLLPEVLGNPESIASESFESGLLEYPQYTKPAEYQGQGVPEVLLSGDHKKIAEWRAEQSLQLTLKRRPGLIEQHCTSQANLSVALIHYPVLNKQGEVVTSSITNIDVHDIARSAKTYGLSKFYVVHPGKTLRRLVQHICEHWESGFGATYNPNRKEALRTISILPCFEDVIQDIEERYGVLPKIISTSARAAGQNVTFAELRARFALSSEPHLLLLGTGWGLAQEILDRADYALEPIYGPTDYNHLSVRAAAAILFDRLLKPAP